VSASEPASQWCPRMSRPESDVVVVAPEVDLVTGLDAELVT
jgi:hypothetical protein